MNWQFPFFLIALGISISLSLLLSLVAWQRRSTAGGRTLFALSIALTIWTITYLIELILPVMQAKILASKLGYFGIASTPVWFLTLTLQICQQERRLARSRWAVWIIPAITILLALTNDLHFWLWSGFSWSEFHGHAILVYHRGPWWWVHVSYSYLCMVLSSLLLIALATRVPHVYRAQTILIIAAGVLPWIGNILYILNFELLNGLDLAPVMFPLTGALLSISMFRYQFLDLNPIARSKIIDTIRDIIVVLDANHRVIDLNPTSQFFIGMTSEAAIGQPASRVLAHWPILANHFRTIDESPTDFRVIPDKDGRWYDTRISPLRNRRARLIGWLILLRDITDQKIAESEIMRLATVIDQAHETIVITDLNGIILYANPHFEKTTGYSISEALGENPRMLKSGAQGREFYEELWKTIKQGKTWEGQFTNKRKDGLLYYEAAIIFPIKDTNGDIINYAAVKRDITAQVQAENALRAFSEKLKILNEVNIRLATANTFDEMYRLAIELGHERLGFERIRLCCVDPENSEFLKGCYSIDETGQVQVDPDRRITGGTDHFAYQLLSGERNLIFHQKDVPLYDDHLQVVGKGDLAAIALWDRQKCTGYIAIDNLLSQKPISEAQLDILKLFAQVLGSISTLKQSEEAVRTYARQQELLNAITQAAIEQTDFQQMLQIIADRLGELLSADGCYITTWDEDRHMTIPGAAYGPFKDSYHSPVIQPQPDEPTFTQAVLATGTPIAVENVFDSPHISPRIASQFPVVSVLALPLIANNQKLGAALIAFNQTHQFTPKEIQIGEQAAKQIALALLKGKSLEQAHQRATEAETLRQATASITVTLKQDETIERILEALNRVVPYDSASVLLRHGEEMEILGGRGFENTQEIVGLRFALTNKTPNQEVFARRQPHIIFDAPLEYEAFREPPHNHIRGWMGVPLFIHDEMIGMLALDSLEPGRFTLDHARVAQAFANQVAITLENVRLFEETQRLATIDSLTNLLIRRHFMELAQLEYQRACRYDDPLSVIMLDIDHFKNINDTYGHLIGDQILQSTARICQTQLRETDLIGRYGGEEFVVLLPETPLLLRTDRHGPASHQAQPAYNVAERLRQAVANTPTSTEQGNIAVTISLGVAGLDETCNSIDILLNHADQALLYAKARGRNRVIPWPIP